MVPATASFSISSPSPTVMASPEELHPAPTTSLLPNPSTTTTTTTTTKKSLTPLLLLLATFLSFASAVLYFSSKPHPSPPTVFSRPLSTLPRPTVILISADGFRFGYQHKAPLPSIRRLIANGTSADLGLVPVFPTLTFPNHYSIVTGLYPSSHGVVNNHFLDPASGSRFSMSSHDPRWWLGEPLWETVANHNLTAATYFWPGSEVPKGSWHCPPKFCQHYNGSVPFEDRVDTVLAYFDHHDTVPSFVTLYFEDPDHQGHLFGPDDREITDAVVRIDDMVGRLIRGLEERGVFDDVTLILLGDHGMVGTCEKKQIILEDLSPWIDIGDDWVDSSSALLSIWPPAGVSPAEVVDKMNLGLSSGKVENGKSLRVFLKEDLPERLHYSASERIPPVIGLPDEGYQVLLRRPKWSSCGGGHGYDNAFFSMRTIFVAHGPPFRKGWQVPSFENVEIYNVIAAILGLKGAPNNGSAAFPGSILLPTYY
ncbi:uncharacterized protein M6B38_396245 [Iris pallida]|uniref:Uncharacterized protein n=1 Tax=Iris pallida TaxID=29817 RepID=A0AAX6FWP0_IRIPA|nr:uncharacterized protein M6B38_396245 [Iris pallida]